MVKICNLSDVDNDGSIGLVAKIDGIIQKLIIVRKNNHVFAYINSCPHIGGPLDLQPGNFLSYDKKNIICSTHGALFKINTGYCIYGPCKDDKLEAVPVRIEGDEVQYDSI
jgi:nitrite reductase/ring-hydroxylating ferredoxin subunit